jgi:fumarylpyruvate hydrolase
LGDLNRMIWKVPEMIAYLSGLFELHRGDLIMSGTSARSCAETSWWGHVEGVGRLTTRVV